MCKCINLSTLVLTMKMFMILSNGFLEEKCVKMASLNMQRREGVKMKPYKYNGCMYSLTR